MPQDKSPAKTAEMTQKSITSGIIRRGLLDNLDYKKELTGARGVDNFQEMRLSDATVNAALLVCTLPVLSARWYIEPADESRQAQKVADFVEECLFEDMTRSWQETLNEILLYLPFGRMPFELVYKFRDDGMIGLKKLSSIWPSSVYSWKLPNGNDGIHQKTVDGDFQTEMEKLVVFVNRKEGNNWEGISILRTAFKHWFMKEELYKIDVNSAERQGLGIPYGIKPDNASPEDVDDMEKALNNIRANEKAYLVYGKGWEVGFLDTKAGTLKDLKFTIQHHERQITKNVLAQFLELGGQGGGGSYALSQDQSKLFLLSLEATASYIRDNLQKYVIKKLVDFNFQVEEYPKLQFEKIGNVDYQKLVTALTQAITAKLITPDSDLEDYLRDVMELPAFSGNASVSLEDVQPMLDELGGEINGLTGEGGSETQEQIEDPENAGFDMDGQPMKTANDVIRDYKRLNTQSFTDLYGSEIMEILTGGKSGVPLSEETKRKISIALSKGKGKKKGAGKNPAITEKQKQVTKLQKEAKDFNDSVRREVLDMKSKGIKLSPEENAKKQLEWFDKKKTISDKIAKLKSEVADIKSATPATPKKPVAKKAHDHDIKPTDEALLKMSEELHNAIVKVQKTIK